jgi:hypothetical protein
MSKQAFFDAVSALPRRTVEVAGYGAVTVRELTVAEYLAFHAARGTPDAPAVLIRHAVIDAEGNPLFDDTDLPRLKQLPATVAGALAKAASELSGLGDEGTRKN